MNGIEMLSIRQELKMTQKDFGIAIGVSKSQICQWEGGCYCIPEKRVNQALNLLKEYSKNSENKFKISHIVFREVHKTLNEIMEEIAIEKMALSEETIKEMIIDILKKPMFQRNKYGKKEVKVNKNQPDNDPYDPPCDF